MPFNSSTFRTILFMSIFSALLAGCRANKNITVAGPFEIHCSVEKTGSWAWFTNGGSPFAKTKVSYFTFKYNGKAFAVSEPNGTTPDYWEALVLKNAPRPALLAISRNVMLVTDEKDFAKVTPVNLVFSEVSSYQLLDGDNGQPLKKHMIYQGNQSETSRFLTGGRYVLVSNTAVLDIETLNIFHIDTNSKDLISRLGGYNPFYSTAVGMSPKKTQLVLVGSRYHPVTSQGEHALICVDFRKNEAYTVPFDHQNTRFVKPEDITSSWVKNHFHWGTDQNGEEILKRNETNKPLFWQGIWSDPYGREQISKYALSFVKPTILISLMDLISREFRLTDLTTDKKLQETTTNFKINETPVSVVLNSYDQTISIYCDEEVLLKTIGTKFDSELSKGQFQEDFVENLPN